VVVEVVVVEVVVVNNVPKAEEVET